MIRGKFDEKLKLMLVEKFSYIFFLDKEDKNVDSQIECYNKYYPNNTLLINATDLNYI